MKNEKKYWVGLSGFEGLGYKRWKLLKEYFSSNQRIYVADKNDWIKLGIKPLMALNWQKFRQQTDLDQDLMQLSKKEIKVLSIENKQYPKLLKETDSPPLVLFVLGNMEVLNKKGLTVVGTRKMTDYGRQVTSKLVKGLVKHGLVIVSGLARGVDGWAHRVCLGNKGKTVAVLGHGLDQVYPKEHRSLAKKIVKTGGAVISEYPLGFPIRKINFPQRDRILAGLTQGTLVIEGGSKSGTKITASFAADYNREVFCVPGKIDSPQSKGTAELIQEGAKLVTKVEDILEELG